MKNLLAILTFAFAHTALAHSPLSQTTINAMNMMTSPSVRACLDQLSTRHEGEFYLQRALLHRAGIDSEYHLYGAFIEGGDMVHGSAHVDVKVGLLPPMGPGFQCRIVSERD